MLPTDEEYDHERLEWNLYLEFRHDLLEAVRFDLPLYFVNREAHSIALAWLREKGNQDIKIRPSENTFFVHPFNPVCDVLYIALDKWEEFLREPDDRRSEPDLILQVIANRWANIRRIAVPEALLQLPRSEPGGPLDMACLPEIMVGSFHSRFARFLLVYMVSNLQNMNRVGMSARSNRFLLSSTRRRICMLWTTT